MKDKFYRINRFNNLFCYFMVTQLGFYITPLFSRPPLEVDLSLSRALLCHTVALLSFASGYGLNALLNASQARGRKRRHKPEGVGASGAENYADAGNDEGGQNHSPDAASILRWRFRPQFFVAAYALTIIGTGIVILQIAVSQNPLDYLRQLLTGKFDSTIRDSFLLTSDEGGLSGALKIFGAVPLSMYLCTLGLPHFISMTPTDRQKFSRLNIVALVCTAVKIFFSLDRLTIIAIIVANIFITVRTRKNLKIKLILVVIFAFLVEFVSRRRVEDVGGLDFIVLYYNLGIVNFQLLLQSLTEYSYGFASILSPVAFVLKFFGYTDTGSYNTFDFRYVQAEYLVGFVYQDFGLLFPLFFIPLGYLYKTIDRKALEQRDIAYTSIYFLVLSLTMTFPAVPAFKSVDFWLGLIVPLILIKLFTRRIRYSLKT